MSVLSIIIPFGTSKERPYIEERVLEKSLFLKELKKEIDIESIFVEGFSSKINIKLKEILERDGHIYIKDNTQKRYSLGACRNLGVQIANSALITFFDVDYYISVESIKKILNVAKIKGLEKNPNMFLIIPCAFLTKAGSEFLRKQRREYWETIVQHDIITKSGGIVRFLSPSSSTIVISKHKYLEIGGNDPKFVGHGYEDFDLFYRLFISCQHPETLPIKMLYDQKSWNFVDYKGFRAMFSVCGYESLMYGIMMYHLWHPEPNNDHYLDNINVNHDYFYERIKKYHLVADGPQPLLNLNSNKRVLMFTKENSSVLRSVRGIIPYIGTVITKIEDEFFSSAGEFLCKDFHLYLENNNITSILFPNPYGNEKRIIIYNYVKSSSLKYYCFDRGALPDSWFFDSNGFNYDSSSYCEKNWNVCISEQEKEQAIQIITNLVMSNNYLEIQGGREGKEKTYAILGLSESDRIVFIPLQTENDTVIKYFSGDLFSYDSFLDCCNSIAADSKSKFVAKKHPLTKFLDKEKYPNIIFAPDDTNISDLIEISTVVLTINSGVGVLAMMHMKPCIITGKAFYSIAGVNYEISSIEELVGYLDSNLTVDKDKVLKFILYLSKFYCFGKSYYKIINEVNTNRIQKIVNYINFYKINIDGQNYLNSDNADVSIYKDNCLACKIYLKDIKDYKNGFAKSSHDAYVKDQETSYFKSKVKRLIKLIRGSKIK